MENMVLGFYFAKNSSTVLLVKKARPDWQKGKLNGIGGHIEDGESPEQAMIREFREETGTEVRDWAKVTILSGNDWMAHVFRSFGNVMEVQGTEDEPVGYFTINDVANMGMDKILHNLKWLIPLCLDSFSNVPVVNYNNMLKDGAPEDEVMDTLVVAHNLFMQTPAEHPMEKMEWTLAFHKLQALLGLRTLRREHPERYR